VPQPVGEAGADRRRGRPPERRVARQWVGELRSEPPRASPDTPVLEDGVVAGPATRGRAAHADLRGIEQADLPTGAQVGDHVGQGAQSEPVGDGTSAFGRSWQASPMARYAIEADDLVGVVPFPHRPPSSWK